MPFCRMNYFSDFNQTILDKWFQTFIFSKESKESDQQYTFLISIELLIDDKTISMSSDNNKHAISSRRDIEVVCKGDT